MNLTKQSPHQIRVSLFMAKMKSDKQPTPPTPQTPTPDVRVLRAKLQTEEQFETVQEGLGVSMRIKVPVITAKLEGDLRALAGVVSASGSPSMVGLLNSIIEQVEASKDNLRDLNYDDIVFTADRQFSMIALADGLADCSVVNNGTATSCGVAMEPIQEIVDCNNMAKFGPGHSFNDAGKLIKPKDHTPPTEEINLELRRQGWAGPELQLQTPYKQPEGNLSIAGTMSVNKLQDPAAPAH